MGVILAGWASNSKWAIYGAMREACQMVSYEIPLGVSIICGLLVAGTLDMVELGYLQGAGIWDWFVFHNPFVFAAFILYFIASLASNKRAPFDLPESESELVAGFHTEYSGLRFSFFFFAEYAGMFIIGGIQAALFLGAWTSPLGIADPIYHLIGYSPIHAGTQYFAGAITGAHGWEATATAMGLGGSAAKLLVLNLYGAFWFVLKAMSIVFIQMWLRWTLPRIRIDQVLYACVKVLLPASLVAFAGTALWVWLVDSPSAYAPYAGITPVRLAHLVSNGSWLQCITQIVLTVIGIGVVLWAVGVVFWAWVHRRTQPPQSFFNDVMPVGQQSFTPGNREVGLTNSPKPQAG
jgi:NADH-quinone oxidoreductase subunit H